MSQMETAAETPPTEATEPLSLEGSGIVRLPPSPLVTCALCSQEMAPEFVREMEGEPICLDCARRGHWLRPEPFPPAELGREARKAFYRCSRNDLLLHLVVFGFSDAFALTLDMPIFFGANIFLVFAGYALLLLIASQVEMAATYGEKGAPFELSPYYYNPLLFFRGFILSGHLAYFGVMVFGLGTLFSLGFGIEEQGWLWGAGTFASSLILLPGFLFFLANGDRMARINPFAWLQFLVRERRMMGHLFFYIALPPVFVVGLLLLGMAADELGLDTLRQWFQTSPLVGSLLLFSVIYGFTVEMRLVAVMRAYLVNETNVVPLKKILEEKIRERRQEEEDLNLLLIQPRKESNV